MLNALWLGTRLSPGDHNLRRPDPLQQGCCDNRCNQGKGHNEREPPTQNRQVVVTHAAPR